MKILFIKSLINNDDADYLGDSVFHGLKKLFGSDVIDYPKNNIMYRDYVNFSIIDKSKMAARGFTLYGILDDDQVDRDDIPKKIKNQYFDLIIYVRPDFGLKHWDLISQYYSKNKVIFLDGMDPEHIYIDLLDKGLYFKRELYNLGKHYGYDDNIIKPISFGFPQEKIQKKIEKTQVKATVIPGVSQTYVFTEEQAYYNDYGQSMFAETIKKGGWDCLRHYEIIGCNSLPLWIDIKKCPERICTTLPKADIINLFDLFMKHGFNWWTYGEGWERYWEFHYKITNHFANNCTTEHVVKYMLDTHRQAIY
jgi:hypothetical protein